MNDTKQTVLTDEEIGALSKAHLTAHAQFVGAGDVYIEGDDQFARAIESAVLSKLRAAGEPVGFVDPVYVAGRQRGMKWNAKIYDAPTQEATAPLYAAPQADAPHFADAYEGDAEDVPLVEALRRINEELTRADADADLLAERKTLSRLVAELNATNSPTRLGEPAPQASAEAFDFHAHLARQREWSERTFGPGSRANGVIDHIRKELIEIESDPGDLREWVDVIILALDGAWRSGATPQQIIDAIVAKQAKNEGRAWPDWRTMDPNKAIEHDRTQDSPAAVDSAIGSDESDMGRWASFADRRQRDADENDREAWAADMIAAGAQHLGGDDWEWDVEDFQFRLWQQAMRRQQRGKNGGEGMTSKRAWWAGYRAGKGLPPDTSRQEAASAHLRCRKCGESACVSISSAKLVTCRPDGTPRDERDIASDPGGKLIHDPAEPLLAAQPAANKVAPTDEQLIALAREVATDATAEQVKLYSHLWVRLCRMALARYSYGMAAHKPDGEDAKDSIQAQVESLQRYKFGYADDGNGTRYLSALKSDDGRYLLRDDVLAAISAQQRQGEGGE
ncbi:dATP/dGTP pyrophosphohydrolase domain-containing protein [Bordetella petrii]|uniref:dATP/dGTP diphosphohydrolase MazZ domain-containing protein n=1 Tax=Bordetella petrii (strain ATCC BAA-461 / DSM 12804 / CCUG 43448 / CIP 107267 / Se-1111R) TaxID=340100 RepID=A9I8R1_BORPD|nr:dATP/dGTP pyrophosphohydrolase domain-containing protein [Bordetella petrii]CAP41278.1 hypothetical protein Bpet0946 [Bordetella petrii]